MKEFSKKKKKKKEKKNFSQSRNQCFNCKYKPRHIFLLHQQHVGTEGTSQPIICKY